MEINELAATLFLPTIRKNGGGRCGLSALEKLI